VLLFAIVPTLATSYAAGSLADRLGSRPLLTVSLAVNGASLLVVAFAVGTGSDWLLVSALVVWGAALPVVAVPARRALMNAVPAEERGQASGINLTIQMLGGTIGIAICSALLLESGRFWPVFALTGAVTLATIVIVQAMIERTNAPIDRRMAGK
jgi:MFS family permease